MIFQECSNKSSFTLISIGYIVLQCDLVSGLDPRMLHLDRKVWLCCCDGFINLQIWSNPSTYWPTSGKKKKNTFIIILFEIILIRARTSRSALVWGTVTGVLLFIFLFKTTSLQRQHSLMVDSCYLVTTRAQSPTEYSVCVCVIFKSLRAYGKCHIQTWFTCFQCC